MTREVGEVDLFVVDGVGIAFAMAIGMSIALAQSQRAGSKVGQDLPESGPQKFQLSATR